MLWRSSYRTVVAENLPLPQPLSPGIYLGIWVTAGLKDAEIWRRLIAEEIGSSKTILFGSNWTGEVISSSLPASVRLNLQIEPCFESWQDFDNENLTFAFATDGKVAKVVMWGPPTEDAWDSFLSCVKGISP